jgi:NAD-dependent DNA ligase adenylation domain|nr:MAG TPA: DNA ligase [Herelleviridae sp.]
MNNEEKIKDLVERIQQAATAYYNTDEPILSDDEFDSLVNELRGLDAKNPILTTPNWGSKDSEIVRHLVERKHSFLVQGLPKEKSTDFNLNALPIGSIISAKLDGISAVAYYKEGILQYVLTRNNGLTGFDITEKLQYSNLPKTISDLSIVWVRGELVLEKGVAQLFGKSNERNMVAGLANSIDITEAHKYIKFVAYDCDMGRSIYTLNLLNELSFEVVRHRKISELGEYSKLENMFDYTNYNTGYPYLVDGVVVDRTNQPTVAVKYPNKKYTTKVVAIHNQISDHGRIIPVIEFEPVNIDGVIIKQCTVTEGLGKVACDKIQDQYGNDKYTLLTDLEILQELPDYIQVPTKTVRKGIKDNLELILNVLRYITLKPVKALNKDHLIAICLTGKLSKPRGKLLEEWEDKVIEVDISKADYLITDDPDSGSSKNKKAKKLGIPVLTEADFRVILGEI